MAERLWRQFQVHLIHLSRMKNSKLLVRKSEGSNPSVFMQSFCTLILCSISKLLMVDALVDVLAVAAAIDDSEWLTQCRSCCQL